MESAKPLPNSRVLPDGCVAVAVTVDQLATPLRVCVVIQLAVADAAAEAVILRDAGIARVYLGCVCDAGGDVVRWVELWVQQSPRPADALWSHAGVAFTNLSADAQWQQAVGLHPRDAGSICTGWESGSPAAIFIDPGAGLPFHPLDPSGLPMTLCRDDALLQRRDLPAYSSTTHRYLYSAADIDEQTPLIPVSPEEPQNRRTQQLSDYLPGDRKLIALNPSAAPMAVRSYSRVGLPNYLNQLLHTDPDANQDWLHPARRPLEAFYLKCRLMHRLVTAVQAAVIATGQPQLNLGPDRIQMIGADESAGQLNLPLLWTMSPVLVGRGNSIRLGDTACVTATDRTLPTVYQPADLARRTEGRANVRVVTADGAFELSSNDGFAARVGEVAVARLPASPPLNLWGHVVEVNAGHLKIKCTAESNSAVGATAGRTYENVPYQTFATVGFENDFYALAVLATEVLLQSNDATLAETVAAITEPGRVHSASTHSAQLAIRLQNAAKSDPALPPTLWRDAVATTLRSFPGLVDESFVPLIPPLNYMAAISAYEQLAAAWESLSTRARGQLLGDPVMNAEIHLAVTRLRHMR